MTIAMPVLACAVCPVCLTTYVKLFSILGIGVGLSEDQHLWLLVTALTLSLLVSAWRTVRTQRAWPLGTAVVGCALVALGHMHEPLHTLEYAGALVLFVGGLTEQLRLRRFAAVHPAKSP